ncbi:pseudouridylate synthase [Maribrevibacterium harenarium]|uniref:tRNA pseudouridine synthase C n=1 Tax=Maribrevibacterium harenarium TaxID=2589817 RepID=A0A501X4Z9_9GAMM|nr:pseudouridine synthase [Maribrevibacterium harenarium]TPE55521.1 pseudouridylate synthase [Maribrevibacterium harenarium]
MAGTDHAGEFAPLELLYQDEHLVIINKPSGLLVHRTDLAKGEDDAVVQRLNTQLGQWVYPVHRLDRATSGALLLALTPEAARRLGSDFMSHTVTKVYHALSRGHVQEAGVVDYPLATLNEEKGRSRFKIEGTEKDAVTHYSPLARFEAPIPVSRYPTARLSLMEARIDTGRKHQIRRHFKHIFHPILGDTRYGCRHQNHAFREHGFTALRLMLHAHRLSFTHPFSGARVDVTAPYPADFQDLLSYLYRHQTIS